MPRYAPLSHRSEHSTFDRGARGRGDEESFAEVGVFGQRAGKDGIVKVGGGEYGVGEVGPAEVSVSEVGLGEVRGSEVGAGKFQAGEILFFKIEGLKWAFLLSVCAGSVSDES